MRLSLTLAGLILLAICAVGAFWTGTASAQQVNRTIISDIRLADATDAVCAIEEELRDIVAAISSGAWEDAMFYSARAHSTARTARHMIGVPDEDVRHRARRHGRRMIGAEP